MTHFKYLFAATCLILIILLLGGCALAPTGAPLQPTGETIAADTSMDEFIVMATTTSTYDSGLLDVLLPPFTEKYGIAVRVISRGTGQALALGQRGDVDILLVHDRSSELRLVDEGYFTDRHDVMYNDFIIVGPSADPAGIKDMTEAAEAFSVIAAGNHTFVSRGDDSGTHRMEMNFWEKAGIDEFSEWYISVGQGMSDTLRITGDMQGYALTDRGTYLSLKDTLNLEVVLQGEPALLNQYGIMAVNPQRHSHAKYNKAVKLIDFMLSPEGEAITASFQIRGESLFFPGKGGADLVGAGEGRDRNELLPPLLEGISEAFRLILTFDQNLMRIVLLSLQVSGMAVLLSTLFGVPLGTYLGLKPAGRTRLISQLLYTLMGLPPVVAGLVIYLLFSRMGPFGVLDLLWTPAIMIIAQFVLALPIIAGLTMISIRNRGKVIQETAWTLGAGKLLTAWTVIRESRFAIYGAIVTGLGRVIAEVGAVMMVGGNIAGHTRVMTTAIVLETGKGNFELAIGLGLVLLVIAFVINSLLFRFQGGGKDSAW